MATDLLEPELLYKRELKEKHHQSVVDFFSELVAKSGVNKDENKANNHYKNLEWCSFEYNMNYGSHPYLKSILMAKNFARDVNPNNKKVRCVETGEVFNCIKDAAEKFKIDQSQITKV